MERHAPPTPGYRTSLAAGSAASTHHYRTCVYLALLSLAAAYFLAWPLWRARFLIEIWPTEGWNSYLQDAAAAGLPIYPPAGSLVGNNYPPLSFYAIGFIGKAFGVDNLFAGRVVSFVALVAVAIEIFLAVRILVGGRAGAAIGALWYLAIMARNSTIYVGTNDPQLGGEAIMLTAVDGRSHEEAAHILGAPEGTIAWRVHEARRKLREYMQDAGFDPEGDAL